MFSKYNTTSVISGSIWTNGFVTWSTFYYFIGHYKTINIYARFSKCKIFFLIEKTLRQDRVTVLIKINIILSPCYIWPMSSCLYKARRNGDGAISIIHYFFTSSMVHPLLDYSDDSKFGFFPYFQFSST